MSKITPVASLAQPLGYVPRWGYGVYDENGDRNSASFSATYVGADGNTVNRNKWFSSNPASGLSLAF